MTPDQRQNTLTWLSGEIRGSYATIIKKSYPTLVGLPIDDGDIVSVALDEMTDDELEAMLLKDERQLAEWIREQVQEAIDGWYRDATEQVLCDHVVDVMADHPHITEDDIRLALSYLKQRSSAIDLVNRFEDEPEQWMQLIELAKLESESGS